MKILWNDKYYKNTSCYQKEHGQTSIKGMYVRACNYKLEEWQSDHKHNHEGTHLLSPALRSTSEVWTN